MDRPGWHEARLSLPCCSLNLYLVLHSLDLLTATSITFPDYCTRHHRSVSSSAFKDDPLADRTRREPQEDGNASGERLAKTQGPAGWSSKDRVW